MALTADPAPVQRQVLGFHEYLPHPGEVAEARRFVRELLEADGADPDLVGAAELIVDEFALNVLQHTASFFSVLVEHGDGSVRVAVRDDSDVFPRLPEQVALSISGRGLTIVAMTAAQWGADSLGRGKEVWAELRRFEGDAGRQPPDLEHHIG